MRSIAIVPSIVASLAGLLAAGAGSAPPKPNTGNRPPGPTAPSLAVPLKPDLVVEKIWVESTQADPSGGTRVTVKYTVFNNSPTETDGYPTAAARAAWEQQPVLERFFVNWVDWREVPGGMFPKLQGDSSTGNLLGPYGRFTWSGSVLVPHGKTAEIRATADSLNWVNENNEANNSKSLTWPASPAHAPLPK